MRLKELGVRVAKEVSGVPGPHVTPGAILSLTVGVKPLMNRGEGFSISGVELRLTTTC